MNDENDIIKTFLKIEPMKEPKSSLYSLDLSKNIISLFSPEGNRQDFELNKIFTSKDENSYIYEIICLNTINESLKGISYSFISYGETVNNKIEFLIGDLFNNYKNINNYGLFIRLLDNLLKKKNDKEIYCSINFSNFLIYENNLIDLTYYGNKKKQEYEIDNNLFLSNGFKIKNNTNIINNMNQINVSNINELIKYLHCIMKFFNKLDKKIYRKSNICFIIYLINETLDKTISTISFISLCGCENLYAEKIQKLNNRNDENEKNVLETTKLSLETRYTFDSIINCIKNNNYIRNCKNENKKHIKEEKNELSQLTTVLYNICFGKNVTNIKYRFIGNIRPNEGYYKRVKDVLLFLFDCSKIMKKKINSNNLNLLDNNKSEEIFNLEYKIKLQSKTIADLNKNLEKQNKKMKFLENIYNEQINAIKKYFNFRGDINILLSGDPNTKEMEYVEKINNHNFLVNKYVNTIEILEKKLNSTNEELKKVKNTLSIKEMDQTMINYYLSAKNGQEKKEKLEKNEIVKELYNKIDKLNKEIINKNKIIEELKKDLKAKNDIFCNFSKSISKKMNNFEQISQDTVSQKPETKNKDKKTEFNESELTDLILKQELEKMKIKEQKEIKELKDKYNYILLEKKNTIYDLEHKFEKIDEIYKNELKETYSEITNIYGMLISLISYIEKNKKNLLNEKNSNELEKIIFSLKDDIQEEKFPCLFKELNRKKNLKEKNEKEKTEENSIQSVKEEEKVENIKINKEDYKDLSKDEIITKLENKIKRLILNYDIQLKKYNNNIFLFGLQQRTIEKLKREINIYKITLKNKNITPPLISLNCSKNDEINSTKIPKTKNKKKEIIQKSFSFISEKGKMGIPFSLLKFNKFNEKEPFNFDSFRQPSTNNTNINSNFRASSPETSYSNTNTNNFNQSLLNKNNNDIFNHISMQKKIKKEMRNKRPFSAIKQRENLTNNNDFKN